MTKDTDRELLEKAAKAAGICIDKAAFNGGGAGNTGFDLAGAAVLDWHNGTKWNPITDDGDALRLAVKLHMSILSNETASWVATGMHQINRAEEHHDGSDPYAATRRAIVRAAAEIGRAMP